MPAGAARDHLRHEEVTAVDHAPQVDPEQPVPVVERGLEEPPADRDARVVDEDVGRGDARVHLVGERRHRGAIRDVDGGHQERARAELVGERLERDRDRHRTR